MKSGYDFGDEDVDIVNLKRLVTATLQKAVVYFEKPKQSENAFWKCSDQKCPRQ